MALADHDVRWENGDNQNGGTLPGGTPPKNHRQLLNDMLQNKLWTPKPMKLEICHVLRTLRPLTAFKNAPNPKFVKNLSRRLFFGVPIRGTQICQKFVKILKNDNFRTKVFQIFDRCLANWAPLIGTPKNNRRDKFLTNLGFGVFLNAVSGRRVRKSRSNVAIDRLQTVAGRGFRSFSQSRKCAINNFWTKKSAGQVGLRV